MPVKKGKTRRSNPQKRKGRKQTKRISRDRKRRVQKGGKFLDKGTYGAVFTPPPCDASITPGIDLREGVEVGKLMPKDDAADELKALGVLQARLGSDPYFLIEYLGECEPDPANPDLASDPRYLADLGDKTVLRYAYGGIPWNEFVAKHLTDRPVGLTPEGMNKRILLYIQNLHSVFYGLKRLQERDVFHRDIKINNIIVNPAGPESGKRMRYIDFGMATTAEYHNKDLRTETSMDHPYWPLDAIVGYTRGGLDFLQLAHKDYVINELFYDKGKATRYSYLMFLDMPRATSAERKASYAKLYQIMRESVCLVLNREFSKDEYALLHPELGARGTKNARGNLILQTEDVEDWWDSLPENPDEDSEVEAEMRRLYLELQNRVRLLCMSKFDTFSLGYSILKLHSYLETHWATFADPGYAGTGRWVMSPDVKEQFDTVNMIAKHMIDPDILKRWGPHRAEAEFTKMFDVPGANAYIAMRKAELEREEAARAAAAEAEAAAGMMGLFGSGAAAPGGGIPMTE